MPPGRTIGDGAAAALVFGASAAVLVVEIVALRLLAPYLGLTLETSTLVIGAALTAIAMGSWTGGRTADVVDPHRALAPLLALSGVAVAVTPFVVRAAAEVAEGAFLLLAAGLTIMVPGALLSAVTPMVVKLRLDDLHHTGTVVGRLSGIGTTGAIAGTVVTGFILISRVPVSGIMVGLGVLLVLAAAAVEVAVRRRPPVVPVVLVLLAGVGLALDRGGCDAETTYHCAVVVEDPQREGGRTLVLDGLRHSYVDLDDPTHLEFRYVRAIAAAVEAEFGEEAPVRAHHLGGGGVTLPRYLDEVRPGTRSTVSEIDPGVVQVDREQLGLRTDSDLRVRVEDARNGLERMDDDSHDLVVGDAFGGVSVPFHLTTVEALSEVERVLTDDGVYAANLIDHDPLAFARAEVATLGQVFEHVALATDRTTATGRGGGNLVALASDSRLDVDRWAEQLDAHDVDWVVLDGARLDRWVDDTPVLTDDYAPVDQLLTPY
ncbi:MAG TPA: fused MFS/spermidine synthase [Marmoricola sp.]|nr:fused MFS/spermidine synthase [Marmoricola sp.]